MAKTPDNAHLARLAERTDNAIRRAAVAAGKYAAALHAAKGGPDPATARMMRYAEQLRRMIGRED